MEMTPQGATVQFDCASGVVLEPIKANAKGEFAARGTYTHSTVGLSRLPIRPVSSRLLTRASSKERYAVASGAADKYKDQAPDPFTLTRGKTGRWSDADNRNRRASSCDAGRQSFPTPEGVDYHLSPRGG